MHPLSAFPQLLTYGLLAPLLLRVSVAAYILFVAKIKYTKSQKFISALFAILGLLLFVGLYTQIAAGLAIVLLCADFYGNLKRHGVTLEQKMIFTFVMVILLSLLFVGPGFLAFDLPL